jgi:SAM-dependent methyltransferase
MGEHMNEKTDKTTPCDICSSTEAVEVPHSREYTGKYPFYICKNCGLVHSKNRKTTQETVDSWNNKVYTTKNLTKKTYTSNNPWIKARITFVCEFADDKLSLKNKEVCDIGAGQGTFLKMCMDKGAKVFGIEPSKNNCNILASMNIPSYCGSIEGYNDKNKKFDIVTIMWTLENTPDPNKMLEQAYDMLKPDGYLVYAAGSRILVPFKKPLQMFLQPMQHDTHPLWFSFNTLKSILSKQGFKVIHYNSYVDNDILCVISQKTKEKKVLKGDDYKEVENFFERWHKENMYYR